jgi:hypothetical protein
VTGRIVCISFGANDGKIMFKLKGTNLCITEKGYQAQVALEECAETDWQKFIWSRGDGNDAFIKNFWNNAALDVSARGCRDLDIGTPIIAFRIKYNDPCSDNQRFHLAE